jgi:AraC-like DNA-binding protein
MRILDLPIPFDLAPWIERLTRVELAPGETLPVFAGARVHIAFMVGGSLSYGGSGFGWHAGTAACLGPVTQARDAIVAGGACVVFFLVKLAGGVAPGVIGRSAEACTDQVLPLQSFWPRVLPPDPRQSPREQLEAILGQLRAAIARFEDDLCWRPQQSMLAMRLLHALPVDAAASELAMSRATFERRVRRHFGITPKKLARIQRFYRALEALSRARKPSESVDLGYFDQSHMISEFRDFSRLTPLGLLTVAAHRPDSVRLYEMFDEGIDHESMGGALSSRQR